MMVCCTIAGQIGSSVRPREVATHGSISRRFEMNDLYIRNTLERKGSPKAGESS